MSWFLYIAFVGMLLLFGGGEVRAYGKYKACAPAPPPPKKEKNMYNIKECSYHYIIEETCICILGQRENQHSSVEQFKSFKTV